MDQSFMRNSQAVTPPAERHLAPLRNVRFLTRSSTPTRASSSRFVAQVKHIDALQSAAQKALFQLLRAGIADLLKCGQASMMWL